MNQGPKIAEIRGLPALVVPTAGWIDDYEEIIRREKLGALSISVRGDDLSFVGRLTGLRGLVLNAWDARDLTPLVGLTELETLTLNVPHKPRVNLDLSAFPKLTDLGMYWNPGFESLFSCRALEQLFVFAPPDPDLARFGQLLSLRRLEVSGGRRLKTTRGIEKLQGLVFLGLYLQSQLEDLTGVSELRALRELAIEGCRKLETVDAVEPLQSLTTLKVANCGEIASLRPLERLECLEQFLAWESTRIQDGDLGVLTRLPRLRQVALASRRHYQPSVREVTEAIASRAPD